MKQFSKTYEDVFSSDIPKVARKLNLDEVSVGMMELDDYISTFKEFLTDFYIQLFNGCVKLSWLRRKFTYYGKKTILPMQKNSPLLNSAFVKLLRREVGKDIQIMTRGKFFSRLELYFDEIFPDFESENPFENPDYYQYPFKNISVDFFIPVHQMEERMEILSFADKQNMSYANFMDYVINYACSMNDELGHPRYTIKKTIDRNFPFYIKNNSKSLVTKRGKKRV